MGLRTGITVTPPLPAVLPVNWSPSAAYRMHNTMLILKQKGAVVMVYEIARRYVCMRTQGAQAELRRQIMQIGANI